MKSNGFCGVVLHILLPFRLSSLDRLIRLLDGVPLMDFRARSE